MLAYLDASALVKLVVPEPERADLLTLLDAADRDGDSLVTSVVGEVELGRVLRRLLPAEPLDQLDDRLDDVLASVLIAELDDDVAHRARWLGTEVLRSLDAIHIATADVLDVDVFVTYDVRQAVAASAHGLRVIAPGAAVGGSP